MITSCLQVVLLIGAVPTASQWRVLPPQDQRQPLPAAVPAEAKPIKPGDDWPKENKFRWLMAELAIPEAIEGKPTRSQPVGMQINCGDGGEVYVNGTLQCRYDNDHPALVLLAEKAQPGAAVRVAVQVYGQVQGGDKFGEANWVLIEARRATDRLSLKVDPTKTGPQVPDGLAGLSQGGGLADYNDDTAKKLKEGGFRWFRMDNILTSVVKQSDGGPLTYDWADFDRRVDFIVEKMGASPGYFSPHLGFEIEISIINRREQDPEINGHSDDDNHEHASDHALSFGTAKTPELS